MSLRDDYGKSERLLFLNKEKGSKLDLVLSIAIAIGMAYLIARMSVSYFFQV